MARNCQSKKEQRNKKKVGKQFSSNIFSASDQTFHALFDVFSIAKVQK